MSHVPWHVDGEEQPQGLLSDAKKRAKKAGRGLLDLAGGAVESVRGAVGDAAGMVRDQFAEDMESVRGFGSDVREAAGAVASGDATLPLPYGTALNVGHVKDLKDGVVGFLKYGFAPLDTKEKVAAVAKWSTSVNVTYADMPPGAMNVELPLGIMPGPGDLQALRDIWRDFKHGETGFWTLIDGVSVIPGAIGAGGFLLGMTRQGNKLGDLGKQYAKLERQGLSADEIVEEMEYLRAERGGMEDAPELLAATRGKSGEVYVGKPGDIHGNVDDMIPAHDKPDYLDPSAQGFRYSDDPDPKHMLSREEAGSFTYPLDALDLRKANLPAGRALDLDAHIAAKHNAAYDASKNAAEDYSIGSSTGAGGDDPLQRFLVAPHKVSETFAGDAGHITAEQVAAFRKTNAKQLAEPDHYLGTWYNPESGEVVLDVSRGTDSVDEARSLAKAGEQEGIFDSKAGEFVATSDLDKPEVRQRLGGQEPEGGWAVARAAQERALTDARMGELLGFDASKIMDTSGSISPRALRQGFTKSDEIEGALREAGALERGSDFNRLWDQYLGNLDPAEAKRIAGRPIRDRFIALTQYSRNLPPESLAAMAAMGHRGKGWYEATARSFAGMFGADAPQVAALVASLSPNVSVKANTRMAMDLWSEWTAAGRPVDEGAIQNLFNMVRANAGPNTLRPSFVEGPGHQVVSNAIQNVQRVLGQADPVDFFSDPKLWKAGDVLSGPKVDPFFANLMGEFGRFTNDTHMNRLSGMKTNSLTNRAAQTAAYQDAANVLQKNLGLEGEDVLRIAEMQEMPWGVARQMPIEARKAGAGRGFGSVEEHFFPGGGSLDQARYFEAQRGAAEAPDIAELLHEPETAANLQRAGYDVDAANARRAGVRDPAAMDEFALQQQEGIRRAARRMDMHHKGDYLMGLTGLLGGVGARAAGGLLDEER